MFDIHPNELSNPRRGRVTLEDYPMGASKRGEATYWIEEKAGKGKRVVRQTTPDGGRPSKPKPRTYAEDVFFVDGPDERFYIVEFSRYGGHYSLYDSTLKYSRGTLFHSEREPAEAEAFEAAKALHAAAVEV